MYDISRLRVKILLLYFDRINSKGAFLFQNHGRII
jgi:hypothetical protein